MKPLKPGTIVSQRYDESHGNLTIINWLYKNEHGSNIYKILTESGREFEYTEKFFTGVVRLAGVKSHLPTWW